MLSNFKNHVLDANPVITYVMASHLWLEHLWNISGTSNGEVPTRWSGTLATLGKYWLMGWIWKSSTIFLYRIIWSLRKNYCNSGLCLLLLN
jgi:hypothetical protein